MCNMSKIPNTTEYEYDFGDSREVLIISERRLNNSIEDIGAEHIITSPSSWGAERVLSLIFLLFILIFGTLGNILVIAAIIVEHRLKNLGNIFVINLAVGDLLVTCVGASIGIVNIIVGGSALPPEGCTTFGLLLVVGCCCSTLSISYIAIDRYWHICRIASYHRWFTSESIPAMVAFIWAQALFLCIPPLFLFSGGYQINSGLGYDPGNELCTIAFGGEITPPPYYGVLYVMVTVFFPIIVSLMCYANIYATVHQSRARVHAHDEVHSHQHDHHHRHEAELLRMFLLVILFAAFWMPYAVAILAQSAMLGENVHISPSLYRWFSYMGIFNSILNFFIYGFSNLHFREAYVTIAHLIFLCYKRDDPFASRRPTGASVSTVQA